MKNWLLAVILGMVTLVGGCNEEQLNQADKIISDVNDLAAGGMVFLESPAGGTIPQPARGIAEIALALIGAGAIAWQQNRYRIMTKTTKAIVKGIERVGREANHNPTDPVKVAIESEMKSAGIFDRADELVSRLKASR